MDTSTDFIGVTKNARSCPRFMKIVAGNSSEGYSFSKYLSGYTSRNVFLKTGSTGVICPSPRAQMLHRHCTLRAWNYMKPKNVKTSHQSQVTLHKPTKVNWENWNERR